ncbi:hypothetical protein Tco_1129632, partial [Tanacetum coccineum]
WKVIRSLGHHPSAAKMSKLDRFLVSEDYGATPHLGCFFHWFFFHGFDDMVRTAWNSFVLEDSNGTSVVRDQMQKAKIHQRGVMVDGEWVDEPNRVKEEFRSHFANRFQDMGVGRCRLNFRFPSRLTADQISDLEKPCSSDKIHTKLYGVVWLYVLLMEVYCMNFSNFHCGLKQGDPLAPYLFILVMESLHLSVSRTVEAGIFTGIKIDCSLDFSSFFLRTMRLVNEAAASIGCSVMKSPFKYLGVMVGGNMSKINSWDDMVWIGRFGGLVDEKWLASKKYGGLAMHGSSFQTRSSFHCSNWLSIIREVSALKLQGIDFLSHCKRRVGSGMQTRFWEDLWLGEVPFNELFPRLYALENNKECSVAVKMQGEIDSSFRRHVRGGVETQQLENIQDLVRSKVLSNVDDRWAWDLNGDGDFCVKDARDLVEEVLLPKDERECCTRWIKYIHIKVKIHPFFFSCDRGLCYFSALYVDGGTFLGALLILIRAGCDILPPLKKLCPQSLRRGFRINEKVRVLLLHLKLLRGLRMKWKFNTETKIRGLRELRKLKLSMIGKLLYVVIAVLNRNKRNVRNVEVSKQGIPQNRYMGRRVENENKIWQQKHNGSKIMPDKEKGQNQSNKERSLDEEFPRLTKQNNHNSKNKEVRGSSNKFSVLNEINDDDIQDLNMLKDKMLVDRMEGIVEDVVEDSSFAVKNVIANVINGRSSSILN